MDDRISSVILERSLEEKLIEALRERLPYESCGAIYGAIDGDRAFAENFVLIRNVSADPERSFAFDPEEWISAYYRIQKNQRVVVGFIHSHPNGSPEPSDPDLRGSLPWGTYWIVGFSEGGHRIAVYRRDDANGWTNLPIARRP